MITASNSSMTASYNYDYMGRRFEKTVVTNSVTNTTTFVYDGWNLVQETSGTNITRYVWGIDLSGTLQGAGGIGGLLAVQLSNSTTSNSATFFPVVDGNGNITDYVDTNGTVVAHYEYGPFGQIIAKSGDKADDFKFRFSSKYYDEETGLLYYGYRYYSPDLGRWINRDPLGERGGVNLHLVAENDVINRVDLFGASPADWMQEWFTDGREGLNDEILTHWRFGKGEDFVVSMDRLRPAEFTSFKGSKNLILRACACPGKEVPVELAGDFDTDSLVGQVVYKLTGTISVPKGSENRWVFKGEAIAVDEDWDFEPFKNKPHRTRSARGAELVGGLITVLSTAQEFPIKFKNPKAVADAGSCPPSFYQLLDEQRVYPPPVYITLRPY